MSDSSTIENLLSWRGGWAARALFDDAVNRHLQKQQQDISLAQSVVRFSSGSSALRYLKKYCLLTGLELDISSVPKEIDSRTTQLIELSGIKNIPYEITSDFWLETLCNHLDTTRKKLAGKINRTLDSEQVPSVSPKELMKSWSFPLISQLLPLSDRNEEVIFVEDDLTVAM